jgi:hypothetical protein
MTPGTTNILIQKRIESQNSCLLRAPDVSSLLEVQREPTGFMAMRPDFITSVFADLVDIDKNQTWKPGRKNERRKVKPNPQSVITNTPVLCLADKEQAKERKETQDAKDIRKVHKYQKKIQKWEQNIDDLIPLLECAVKCGLAQANITDAQANELNILRSTALRQLTALRKKAAKCPLMTLKTMRHNKEILKKKTEAMEMLVEVMKGFTHFVINMPQNKREMNKMLTQLKKRGAPIQGGSSRKRTRTVGDENVVPGQAQALPSAHNTLPSAPNRAALAQLLPILTQPAFVLAFMQQQGMMQQQQGMMQQQQGMMQQQGIGLNNPVAIQAPDDAQADMVNLSEEDVAGIEISDLEGEGEYPENQHIDEHMEESEEDNSEYCYCVGGSGPMVSCSVGMTCSGRVHRACEDIDLQANEDERYICSQCAY